MATTDRKRLRVMILFTLQVRTRRDGERLRRFQILDHSAQVDRLGIKCLVLRDLRSVQYFEPIAFEHFLSAPALKGHDLTVNTLFAGAVEVTQVRAHERPSRRNLSCIRQEIDMKMRDPARTRGHFAPTVHDRPANKTTRALMVSKVASKRAPKEPNILIQRVELIA